MRQSVLRALRGRKYWYASLLSAGVFAGAAHAQPEMHECNIILPDGAEGVHAANLWPGGLVPYAFNINVSSQNRQRALDAMAEVEAVCGVDFVQRTTETAYISFKSDSGNSSAVGRTGERQNINIASWSARYVIIHEIMHALGIPHEQSRPDRDDFIIVHLDRIPQDKEHNFDIWDTATMVGPYDWNSVMHYGRCAFSICDGDGPLPGNLACGDNPDICRTIEMQPGFEQFDTVIGNRSQLSIGDVTTLQAMYGMPAPLPNDNCADAQVLPGVGTHFFTTLGATTDGAPHALCDAAGEDQIERDVWFEWTPQSSGTATVETCNAYLVNTDSRIAVYAGSQCTGPILRCNDDACGGNGLASRVSWPVLAGTTYKIRVGHFPGVAPRSGLLRVSNDITTNNDNCLGAEFISGDGTFGFSNIGATAGGLDVAQCANPVFDRDVWFEWRAAASGMITIETCGLTAVDTKIALYDGTFCNDPVIACSEDVCGAQSRITTEVVAGRRYLIRIGVDPGANRGIGNFTISTAVPPSNDNCVDATPIFGSGVFTFDNDDATLDGPLVVDCDDPVGSQIFNDIWYEWTPDRSGPTTIHNCSLTSTDTKIALYAGGTTGICVNAVVPIACSDDACSATNSSITVDVVSGQTYMIRMGAAGVFGGLGLFVIDPPPAPLNDGCEDATTIGIGQAVVGVLNGADQDGEGSCDPTQHFSPPYPDVWFRVVPPADGVLVATTCGNHDFPDVDQGEDLILSLHTGCPGTPENEIACSDNEVGGVGCSESGVSGDPYLATPVLAGEPVYIRVATKTFDDGLFSLGTFMAPVNDTCAGAIPLEPDTTIGGDLRLGTASGTSISCEGSAEGKRDLWYSVTAPGPGTIIVNTCGTDDMNGVDQGTNTNLAAFTTCMGGQVACQISNNSNCGAADTAGQADAWIMVFPQQAGETFYIRVSHRFGGFDDAGPFILNVDYKHPSDTCPDAEQIAGFGVFSVSTLGADTDGPTACGGSGDNQISHDVWFAWTSPTANRARISTCGLVDFDSKIAVYAQDPGGCAGALLACNDDFCFTQSQIEFNAAAGQTYLLRIGSADGNPPGEGQLQISEVPVPPPNDACARAIAIGENETVLGTLLNATNDQPSTCDPGAPFPPRNGDVWYIYRAPCSHSVKISTCGTHDRGGTDRGVDTLIDVWRDCLTTTPIACNDNWNENPRETCGDRGETADAALRLTLSENETIRIRVTRARGGLESNGEFLLTVENLLGSCCPCEIDGAPGVDVFDLLAYLDDWFAGAAAADIDGTPGVDVFDLLFFLDCWFPASAGAACT